MHYDMCVERKEDKENMNKFLKGAMIVGLSVAMVVQMLHLMTVIQKMKV